MDDDESLCKAVKRLLFASSITTNIFLSAESFLAEGHVREPDCLIVDIQLGGMSGLELQRSLHAVGRHIPIIFITAQDDPRTKAEAVAHLSSARANPGQSLLSAVVSATSSKSPPVAIKA